MLVKFIYSEKSTKCCEIITLLLSYVVPVKSKVKVLQNFVAFSEHMNFKELENKQPSLEPTLPCNHFKDLIKNLLKLEEKFINQIFKNSFLASSQNYLHKSIVFSCHLNIHCIVLTTGLNLLRSIKVTLTYAIYVDCS